MAEGFTGVLLLRSDRHASPARAAAGGDCVQQAAAGDVCAFEQLYRTHLPRVHSLVRRLAGGRDTDELTQDVFVRVWQKLSTFRGDAAFATWLHRLAVNVVIERFRADTARRRRLYDGDAVFDTLSAPLRSRDVSLDFETA
ncbi:MAG: sigma-70 family RNA polymerase sigma factor, partial [Vicinamibacterales bacterium]